MVVQWKVRFVIIKVTIVKIATIKNTIVHPKIGAKLIYFHGMSKFIVNKKRE